MSHVRYLIEGSDTGYTPRGDQLYLAITRGPSAARAEGLALRLALEQWPEGLLIH